VNALLALAVADLMGVAPSAAAAGVAEVEPAAMRGEVRAVGGLTMLIDCYNASPQSVRAALEMLETLPAPRGRVAVLGTMLELGSHSDQLHDDVLADALGHDVERFVAVGEFAQAARRSTEALRAMREGRLVTSDDVESAYAKLAEYLRDGVAVLLKASRGVRLERLLEPLQRDFGDGGGA
jgi:UDP-N-acetylmuramoyl-tripeptide--D-alanyl-D-alanine ligase